MQVPGFLQQAYTIYSGISMSLEKQLLAYSWTLAEKEASDYLVFGVAHNEQVLSDPSIL